MRKILNEFKEFAVKGNVVDMAVGIVVGVAFGKAEASRGVGSHATATTTFQ